MKLASYPRRSRHERRLPDTKTVVVTLLSASDHSKSLKWIAHVQLTIRQWDRFVSVCPITQITKRILALRVAPGVWVWIEPPTPGFSDPAPPQLRRPSCPTIASIPATFRQSRRAPLSVIPRMPTH